MIGKAPMKHLAAPPIQVRCIRRGEAFYLDWSGDVMLDETPLPIVLNSQAERFPTRTFLAERADAGWQRLTFEETKVSVDVVAAGLLAKGARPGHCLVVIARNGIEHAILMFAAMRIGMVVAPLSPLLLSQPNAQALVAELINRLRPWAIASDFDIALAWVSESVELMIGLRSATLGLAMAALRCSAESVVQAPMPTPSDRAKILFTSGSSGPPKGVIYTHRMLSTVQSMQEVVFPISQDPEVSVDWLPWHHTYGGNVNLNAALWRGDAIFIDEGLPLPGAFDTSLENLADIGPTVFAGVPSAYELLVQAMDRDAALAQKFFRSIRGLTSGGAALAPQLVARLQAHAVAATGYRMPIGAGYGQTETGGIATLTYWPNEEPRTLGLPPPGVTIKLVPLDLDRFEARVAGPNVTPGYFDDVERTAAAFDEEGFLRTGDALSFIDPDNIEAGLAFAGRLSEEFKLSNGVFVRVDRLRAELMEALTPFVRDVLIVGENRDRLGALVWLSRAGEAVDGSQLAAALERVNKDRRGASQRIAHIAPLRDAPNASIGELTDKGTLRGAVMRQTRSQEIEDLFESSREGDPQIKAQKSQ